MIKIAFSRQSKYKEKVELLLNAFYQKAPRACTARVLKNRQGGFTLLETILTLAILGVVLVLALSSVRLGIGSWKKGESVVDAEMSTRFLFERLYRDIGSMYPYMKRDGMVRRLVFIGKAGGLGFVSAEDGPAPGIPSGGMRWMYYSAGDKGLTVREKTVPSTGLTDDSGGVMVELDHTVRDIVFEYSDGNGWNDNWDANINKGLPDMIKATLFFVDDRRPLEVIIPVNISRLRT